MNRIRWMLTLCAVALAGWTTPAFAQTSGFVPGYALVKIQPGADINALVADLNDDNDDDGDTAVLEQVPGTTLYSLSVPDDEEEDDFVARILTKPEAVYAEQDAFLGDPQSLPFDFVPRPNITPTTPRADSALLVRTGLAPMGYHTQAAYSMVQLGKSHWFSTGVGVRIAVLDTGVYTEHAALLGRCLPGYNAIAPLLPPDEFADGSSNQSVGHGTMVAGILARLAPGADILPVRVLDGDGVGTGLNIIKGIYWAFRNQARVINLSLGTSERLEAMAEAIAAAQEAGAVVVASAGNEGSDALRYPAAYPNVLGVASIDGGFQKSDFSNYGTYLSLSAPGNGIQGPYWDGGYARWSGTSFAAPFVAGKAALIIARRPTLTAAQVRQCMMSQVANIEAYNSNYPGMLGAGLIRIETALRRIK